MSTKIDIASPELLTHLKRGAVIAALVAAGIVGSGIFNRVNASKKLTQWTDQQAIPTVITVLPNRVGATQALILPGQLAAFVTAPIYARVPGYLRAWYTDIGTHVKAGQLLGLIETPDLDQQLQQAQADLRTATANQKLAETTADRWTRMLAEDSVSQQEADEKKSDLLAKRATAEAMRANVRRLETLVSFKRLVAPFDGIVTARKTDVGALIQAGGGNDPELFTVSDVRQLRVYVSVPQINAAAIKAGLSASLTVPERPGMTFAAKLVDTDHAITPASGTLLVQLIVDNRSGLLLPGEYTEVHFTLPVSANTLRVPASTLIFQKNGLQIAVVGKDNRVQLKPITIGTDLGSQVEIATGLQPNDRVVDNPPDSLAPGDLVQVAANSVANSSKIALSRRVRT